MLDRLSIASILGFAIACGPAASPAPPPTPAPRPVTAIAEPTPPPVAKPAPDPAKERLTLMTSLPTPTDKQILQRLTNAGCVNLLHNSNHRVGACASALRRACPPSDRDSPEAEALARTSWNLLQRLTVAFSHPRAWAAAQRCAASLIDKRHVGAFTMKQAQRLANAKRWQALSHCLSTCRLSADQRAAVTQLEGGRARTARFDNRIGDAEDKLKTMASVEDGALIMRNMNGTAQELSSWLTPAGRAAAPAFRKRIELIRKAVRARASVFAITEMAAHVKNIQHVLADARKLPRANDVSQDLMQRAPKVDDMLSSARELFVDLERAGTEPKKIGLAAYKKWLDKLEKRWQKLQPRIKKRAEQLSAGERQMDLACTAYRAMKHIKGHTAERRKLSNTYLHNRAKLRRARIKFNAQKHCK